MKRWEREKKIIRTSGNWKLKKKKQQYFLDWKYWEKWECTHELPDCESIEKTSTSARQKKQFSRMKENMYLLELRSY